MIVFIVLNALDNIGEAKEIMTTDDFNINPVIKQGYKIVVAEAYICGFLLVYNLLNKKEKLKSCLLAIPVICGMGISVCGGNRVEILKIISGILFFYYILDQVMCGWKSRPNIKLIKITMPIVVVFIAMFSFLRTVTKADPTVQDNMGSVVDYTAYYGGSPIQVLNLKIHRGIDNWRTNYFARQTFSGVYDFLAKHHMMELPHARYGSMVYVGGDSNASGNVDTIFGRTYNDFGLFGMAAFIFGLYYYFSRFYYRHIYRHPISKSKDIYRLIMYAFFYSIVIVFAFYDTTVYFIFSQTGVLQILVLLFLMKFQLPKKRVTC
jgi:oligosaccharide repeat unit polymerase